MKSKSIPYKVLERSYDDFREFLIEIKVGQEKFVYFTKYVIHYVIINFGVHKIGLIQKFSLTLRKSEWVAFHCEIIEFVRLPWLQSLILHSLWISPLLIKHFLSALPFLSTMWQNYFWSGILFWTFDFTRFYIKYLFTM